jgi:hypothetical protein
LPAALAVLAAGCGDNLTADGEPLVPSAELVVVARPGDELLLMQPDIHEAVERGTGVTVVYLTAGSLDGLKAAYAHAAVDTDWRCGAVAIADASARHCRLASSAVSLVMFERAESLAAATVDELADTLTNLVRETRPATVRTLEVTGTHGLEDTDRLVTGGATLLALARASSRADLLAYRGDAIAGEPATKPAPIFDAAFAMYARYAACATGCAPCGQPCRELDPADATLLARRYAIGFRRTGGGRLRTTGNQCLGETLALASCAAAPAWALDSAGELRSRDHCLAVAADGSVELAACVGGASRRFFVDDEGHVISGATLASVQTGDTARVGCLVPASGGVRVASCPRTAAPRWELVPDTVTTARADIDFTATGRDVRLGDVTGDNKADLCAITDTDGLYCAPGTGRGGFGDAVRIDDPARALTIDPRSLVLGDVDGDGRPDACGRDNLGILCAIAADDFKTVRWSPAFGDDTARLTTSASLTAIDADGDRVAELCGATTNGIVCASQGVDPPTVLSTWPDADATVWLADLDGDRHADWGAATDSGPACAVHAQASRTTDGAPWSYAIGGMVDVVPATTATVALADIDGDGRADLCTLRDDRIVCARSQGRAFGPRATTLAVLPNQSVASALWLGDLDGDGRADPCVDAGATIICAVQP